MPLQQQHSLLVRLSRRLSRRSTSMQSGDCLLGARSRAGSIWCCTTVLLCSKDHRASFTTAPSLGGARGSQACRPGPWQQQWLSSPVANYGTHIRPGNCSVLLWFGLLEVLCCLRVELSEGSDMYRWLHGMRAGAWRADMWRSVASAVISAVSCCCPQHEHKQGALGCV